MNRIKEIYVSYEAGIKKSLDDGKTTQEKMDNLHSDLDMGIEEYVRFQELKTLAVASKSFSVEEGMTIYRSLGESPEHFNKQPLHVKVALTNIFHELLTKQVKSFV